MAVAREIEGHVVEPLRREEKPGDRRDVIAELDRPEPEAIAQIEVGQELALTRADIDDVKRIGVTETTVDDFH